jgi:hypothetical protein
MSEITCLRSMYMFYKAVIAVFAEVYLRHPNVSHTTRLLSTNETKEFSGHDQKHRLHTLRVEELSICMTEAL